MESTLTNLFFIRKILQVKFITFLPRVLILQKNFFFILLPAKDFYISDLTKQNKTKQRKA